MPLISAKYGARHQHEIRLWGDIKKGFTHFADGDVGLAKITPCFENGKSAVFRNLAGGIGAGTTELLVLRPILVNADYILVFLKSPTFIHNGIPLMTGTAGQKRVPRGYFAESPFPLPPLAEQHRIVAKVEELMALCDELEAAQQKRELRRDRVVAATLHALNHGGSANGGAQSFKESARFYFNHLPRLTTRPGHIKQLRQTILALAIRGRLATQQSNDEFINDLLIRVNGERKAAISSGRTKEWTGAKTDEDGEAPHDVPAGWRWTSLGQLIVFGPQNGVSPKESKDPKSPKALTLTATTSGRFDSQYFKHIDLGEEQCEKYWLQPGDVLFQRGNTREYVGTAAVYDGPGASFVFPDLMIRVRFASALDLQFIHLQLQSPQLRSYFAANATGASSTMPKINQETLLNTPLAIPPIEEQRRIVLMVNELMALCDKLETYVNDAASTGRILLDATLHEALNSTTGDC
jgi:type I restriction enzyme S subunit